MPEKKEQDMDNIGTTTTLGELSDLIVEKFFENKKHLNLPTEGGETRGHFTSGAGTEETVEEREASYQERQNKNVLKERNELLTKKKRIMDSREYLQL